MDDLFAWVEESHIKCRGDQPQFCYELGKLYMMGREGIKPNIDYAIRYFEIGCEKGSGNSCYILSTFHETNDKEEEATHYKELAQQQYFKQCTNKDDNSACLLFATIMLDDKKNPQRYPRAIQALEKGCSLGDSECCLLAGNTLLLDDHPSNDFQRAIKFLEKSCNAKNGDGCFSLANIKEYSERDQHNTNKQVVNSSILKLYKKSCDLGCMEGCISYGNNMVYNKKYKEALLSFSEPCKQGYATACSASGYIHNKNKDTNKAKQFFSRACELGDNESCEWLKNNIKE